jgi:3'-phosphoadenosine 5'-phosphosulfate sulfotransferase (PAPS reductase)/FAD synthetase
MKHIVGFSGGIDSQAAALWVRNRYPAEDIILLNTNAGRNEAPMTEEFIAWYSANVFPVNQVTAIYADLWKTEGFAETKGLNSTDELTFKELIRIKKRPPSRKAQFCTEVLKLIPSKRWIGEHVKDDYERYTGVRREESEARKDTPAREWDDYFDCYVNHPLMDWTKKMCFDYVEAAGEQFNGLYKLGFNRVGCAPCINSGKDDILLWEQRFPDMIEKVRDYESIGYTFFAPRVPGKYTNNIDEVLEWAKTSRGGKQLDMLRVINDRPACESKYGLCE